MNTTNITSIITNNKTTTNNNNNNNNQNINNSNNKTQSEVKTNVNINPIEKENKEPNVKEKSDEQHVVDLTLSDSDEGAEKHKDIKGNNKSTLQSKTSIPKTSRNVEKKSNSKLKSSKSSTKAKPKTKKKQLDDDDDDDIVCLLSFLCLATFSFFLFKF
jgi:cell division protein FtsX